MVKRTKLEIIRDMLDVVNKGKEVKITHLIYKSNLSNNSIKPYIEDLINNGLVVVEIKDEKKLFKITKKGQDFLIDFNKMKVFSESYGLS